MYPAGQINIERTSHTYTVLSSESLYKFMYFLTTDENTNSTKLCRYKFINNIVETGNARPPLGWYLTNDDWRDDDVCWPQPIPTFNTDQSGNCIDYEDGTKERIYCDKYKDAAFMMTMPERNEIVNSMRFLIWYPAAMIDDD